MIIGEKKRAKKLLIELRKIEDSDSKKTNELKSIEKFLGYFFEEGQEDICYELCNKGLGDLIIALETPSENVLVTTNFKEYDVICSAINQEYQLLS